jgi:hypothetical protein
MRLATIARWLPDRFSSSGTLSSTFRICVSPPFNLRARQGWFQHGCGSRNLLKVLKLVNPRFAGCPPASTQVTVNPSHRSLADCGFVLDGPELF